MTYAVRATDLTVSERLTTFPADLQAVAPLSIFQVRCETLALLVAAGELDLHYVVDLLHDEAAANRFNTDEAQAVMNKAFRPDAHYQPRMNEPPRTRDYWLVAEDGVASPGELQRVVDDATRRRNEREAPQTTIEALKYAYRTASTDNVFEEPANKERLSRLSARQREELGAWIKQRGEK